MSLLLQLLQDGLVKGVLFALMACSFGLIYRSVRVFHFAFAGLFLFASYAFYAAQAWLGLPLWLAFVVSVAVCGWAGWATERWFYRPFFLCRASPGAVMVASLGLFICIENVLALVFGRAIRLVDREMAASFGTLTLTSIDWLQLAAGAVILAAFVVATRRVRLFKAIWAMGDEPGLIPVLGLPLMHYRAVVFTLSAVLGAIPACLLALKVGINPQMGMSYLLIATVAMLAGGSDSYFGWILGGLVVAILQSVVVWKIWWCPSTLVMKSVKFWK